MPTPDRGRSVLLDTHVWVWLEEGLLNKLARRTHSAIEDAARRGALLVSVISVWEIGMLEAKGRLRFDKPRLAWVEEALATPGLTLAPLTAEIAREASALPGECHADPADRILLATRRGSADQRPQPDSLRCSRTRPRSRGLTQAGAGLL